jgi:hypothetical protein
MRKSVTELTSEFEVGEIPTKGEEWGCLMVHHIPGCAVPGRLVRWTRAVPESFGCDSCAWDDNRLYGHVPEVTSREGRRLSLVQCHLRGATYEQNEDGSVDRRLTQEEADLLFPGCRQPPSN